MLDYDIKLIGPKVEEIYPSMKAGLEKFSDNEGKINYVRGRLFECIQNDDIITALAIVDCFIGITGNSGKDLSLQKNDSDLISIEKMAYDTEHGDFAFSFIGQCKALHYFDE
ncbi:MULTISPECIES: hypothetical protein [unclassified Rickettsia]|uniref:hypothetical protein n=1 Tax=unclassified Rickettsia TaxID=114295 RepID=UPI00209D34A3|nr:hypothetical protein [Rickettsia endosymbiont of Ceutorhynchus assimilis]